MPLDVKSVSDIPHDFRPNPLGSRAEVITRIREIFPQADFSDPSWGLFDVAGFSIEFNMGRKEISRWQQCRGRYFAPVTASATTGF